MSQLSANVFSNREFEMALQELGINGGYMQAIKRGNVLIVIYTVWDEKSQRWVKGSRFVSVNLLLKMKLRNTIAKSKTVQFDSGTSSEVGYTSKVFNKEGQHISGGHTVTLFSCTCPIHQPIGKLLSMKAGESHDRMFTTCKHQLAFAKTYHGCQKLSDLTQLRENILSDRLIA